MKNKNLTKIAASVALVAGAASVAGLGTFGAFTSTTSASQQVSAGTVKIDLGGQAGRGFDVAATNLVPGDSVQRAVVLTRAAGSEQLGSVSLTTSGTTDNKLVTDAHGLKLTVEQCPSAWTKVGATNALTCATPTVLLSTRAVVGTAMPLGGATTTLNSGTAAANLRVTLTLPESADNSFQGLANTIGFTFDATQRAGTVK